MNRLDTSGSMYVTDGGGQRLSPEEAKENIEQWKAYYRGVKKEPKPFPKLFGASYSVESQYSSPQVVSNYGVISYSSGTGAVTTYEKTGDASRPISVYAVSRIDSKLFSSAGIKMNIAKGAMSINLGLNDISINGIYTNGNRSSTCSIKLDLYNYKIGFETKESVVNGRITEYTYSNISFDILSLAMAVICIGTSGNVPNSQGMIPAY